MSLVYFPIEYCPGDGEIPPANPPGVALGLTHWMAAPAAGGQLFLVCTGGPPGYRLEASFTLPVCPDCLTASEILEGAGR